MERTKKRLVFVLDAEGKVLGTILHDPFPDEHNSQLETARLWRLWRAKIREEFPAAAMLTESLWVASLNR